MYKRSFFLYGLVLSLFINCGKSNNPMPSFETYEIAPTASVTSLSKEWLDKLERIKNEPGANDFKSNIEHLTIENRNALLEILNVIPSEDQELRFLQDFVSFNKEKQATLIAIILHLESNDKPLLLKTIQCPECLSLIDQIKVYNQMHKLDPIYQKLLMEFEGKLEEDSE